VVPGRIASEEFVGQEILLPTDSSIIQNKHGCVSYFH